MTTLEVGIATYQNMKDRIIFVIRGGRHIEPDEPKVWFTSSESFVKILNSACH